MATIDAGITTILTLVGDLPAEWMILVSVGAVFGVAVRFLRRVRPAVGA